MKKLMLIRCLRYVFLVIGFSSCEEMIDVGDPRSELGSDMVFQDDLTATAAAGALYQHMTAASFVNLQLPMSLSGDDLMLENDLTLAPFYYNDIQSINAAIESMWRHSYTAIYNANALIEGLENSNKVSASLSNQLLGEALVLRAFYHFYLVNLFGNVPYITTTDYRANGSAVRIEVVDVYVKIINDLASARDLLEEDYAFAKGERVRINKWAAVSLLARVYLYTGDWAQAEEQASRVIEKTSLYKLSTDLTSIFNKNNKEAIWQLIPDYPQQFTLDGGWLNKAFYALENPRITEELFDSFEVDDQRKGNWIATGTNGTDTWHYAVKYKETSANPSGNEYSVVIRLAELYLVRAEARARRMNLIGANSAQTDLNTIRTRAGLDNTTATTQDQLLAAVENEKRLELFTEWGHRWLDLKRTDHAVQVLSTVKPLWEDTDVLYPIPFSEMRINNNLQPQNDGY
jgi:hypothetical protein